MINQSMKDLYIAALQTIKKPSDGLYELFKTPWTYTEELIEQGEIIAAKTSCDASPPGQAIPVSENTSDQNISGPTKKTVLESFTQFAEEKLESNETISFKGGELKQKSDDHSFNVLEIKNESDLIDLANTFLDQNFINAHYKNLPVEACKVLFVSDIFINESYQDNTADNKFTNCFDTGVSELFSKMVLAMGLKADEVFISATKDEQEDKDLAELLLAEINYLSPQFIISLGAQATSFFLGKEKKLRNCHGQLFQLNFNSDHGKISKASMMPLFSPKLLNIAPNMKKTAWEDMQKFMQKL